jgi:Gram-negative bacterial TonB protein C-terminal
VEPEFAKTLRNNERCIVALTVGTDGKTTDVHIALASKNEDNGNLSIETRMICLNAAEQYRFKPATFQGKPVAVDLKVEISFKKFP